MDETKKKIQELLDELAEVRNLCSSQAAKMWSEKDWKDAKIYAKELVSDIKSLAQKRISELKKEQEILEKRYPKFSKRFIYKFVTVPEDVVEAEKRYSEIEVEIAEYQSYLK